MDIDIDEDSSSENENYEEEERVPQQATTQRISLDFLRAFFGGGFTRWGNYTVDAEVTGSSEGEEEADNDEENEEESEGVSNAERSSSSSGDPNISPKLYGTALATNIKNATNPSQEFYTFNQNNNNNNNNHKSNAGSLTSRLFAREISAYKHLPFTPSTKNHITSTHFLPLKAKEFCQYGEHVFCGQFSHDGSVYMTACQDGHLRLYNTATWRRFKLILARYIGWSIIDTDYSPDQRFVAYSSWSPYVHLCNIYGEAEIHDALEFVPVGGDRFCLFSIKFSPDSRAMIGGANDGCVYFYDLERKEREMVFRGHDDDINSVSYLDGSGNLIVSGSDDELAKLWDTRILNPDRPKPVGVFVGHQGGITHISSKGDGRYLITNAKDQELKLWDIRNIASGGMRGRSHRRFYYGFRDTTRAPHPEDKSLMTYRGHVVSRTLIRAYFSPLHTTGQRYIYSGSANGCAYIYDVLSGKVVETLKGHQSIIRDLSWHPFIPELITTSWDCTVRHWTPHPLADRTR
eukprot:TRINITY_DN1555_c0_g1_i2.p1 TRINITY_DN1555_c0_g1~~TRINITY_DN1555_c0_g1_i2.p1  ORF type:complete len:518 (-),score=96.42 TRINITY_DN1555_c0_g1_i2:158-1711(-)